MTPLTMQASLFTSLQNLLLKLYRNWYGLPLSSTRKHLETYRTYLATLLEDIALPKAELRKTLQDFLHDCERLPVVAEVAESEINGVRKALTNNDTLGTEDRHSLLRFLQAADPTEAALATLHYLPDKVSETLEAVQTRLNLTMSSLSFDDQVAVEQILFALNQELTKKPAYALQINLIEQVLLALEQIPAVRQIAWQQFSAGKVTAQELVAQSKNSYRGTHKGWSGNQAWSMSLPSAMALEAMSEVPKSLDLPSGAEVDEARSVRLFSDIRFPAMTKQYEETALIVRLTPQQQEESSVNLALDIAFANASQPELVDVVVSAPGFSERLDSWHRTIKVYVSENSEPAIFLLKGETLGKTQLKIDFRHRERLIGTATLACEVGNKSNSAPAKLVGEAVEIAQFLSAPPPPADLELRIVLVDKTLQFMLHSANPTVGYHWQKVGETRLRTNDPGRWLGDKIEQLNRLARISRDFGRTPTSAKQPTAVDPTEIIDGIGTDLWDELVPKEFKNEYWGLIKKLREAGVLKSLLITSDEPWIPWEMLKPYRVDEFSQQAESDRFWAESFTVCRWLAGRGPLDGVTVSAASIVAPVLDLPNVQREVKGIRDYLTTHNVVVGDEIKTIGEVQAAIKGATVQLLHFATHGSFESENVERSKIALQDGVLTPDDLSLSRTANLRLAHPLIFLNTCNAGRLGFTPTDLGGWADRLLRNVRAFAVIGAQWEVNDALAADFAEIFYKALLDNQPLGQAFQKARLAIQQKDPLNPTWLAYTLYGDPHSRVTV